MLAFRGNKLFPILPRLVSAMYSTGSENSLKYETLAVSIPKPFVYHVELNRPQKLNAMNAEMWTELSQCFDYLGDSGDCRVVVLTGAGKLFCAGLDFASMMQIGADLSNHEDVARKCKVLRKNIKHGQDGMSSLEKCCKPVIVGVHGACVGGGVDLITAADIRYCSQDAWFQIKEVDIGMAADIGTLQRLPRAVGSESLARELALTGRRFSAQEAAACGLVSRVLPDRDQLLTTALQLAEEIAAKSPLATQLTKRSMVYSRDHSVQEGLDHIRDWNQTMLQSEDFINATTAQATKSPPPAFSKL